MAKYKITKDNVFDGLHTFICTLETWAEFGWMITPDIMVHIKEYMPIIAHRCNMVSNYSNTALKKEMTDVIELMIAENELIHIDTYNINNKRSDWMDVFEIPSMESETCPKQKYLIALSIGDIKIFIWRKKTANKN